MDSELVAGIVPSLVALAGIAFQWWRHGGRRSALLRNLDVYGRLPDSDLRTRLLDHIHKQVAALIEDEDERRRDPAGIVLGLVFVAFGTWLLLYGFGRETWQWAFVVPGFVVLLLGSYGFVADSTRRKRDERGRVIE